MDRRTRKDVALSDGIVIPAGNTVAVAMFSTHYDAVRTIISQSVNFVSLLFVENPNKFDGLRFLQNERRQDQTSVRVD